MEAVTAWTRHAVVVIIKEKPYIQHWYNRKGALLVRLHLMSVAKPGSIIHVVQLQKHYRCNIVEVMEYCVMTSWIS